MIVCSCNRLSHRTLAKAAAEIASEPDRGIITPGAVFKSLGCRPECGGCFPLVVDVIHRAAVEAEIADVRLERTTRSGRILLAPRLATALGLEGTAKPAEAACGCQSSHDHDDVRSLPAVNAPVSGSEAEKATAATSSGGVVITLAIAAVAHADGVAQAEPAAVQAADGRRGVADSNAPDGAATIPDLAFRRTA